MEHSAFKATAFKSTLWFNLTMYLLVTQLENPDPVFKIVFRETIPLFFSSILKIKVKLGSKIHS